MLQIQPNDFAFQTDKDSFDYIYEIVEIMMTKFGITSSEAIGRINKHFERYTIINDNNESEHSIYREFPGFWANEVYFGHESFWWVEGEKRIIQNLPKLKPLPYTKENKK